MEALRHCKMRPTHALLLTCTGLSLALISMFLMSQGGVVPSTTTWPPARKQVFNLADTSISISPGQAVVVYAVPPDRWLTITEIDVFGGSGTSAGQGRASVFESFGGVDTLKIPEWSMDLNTGGGTSFWGTTRFALATKHPELGWVFRPGSQVKFVAGITMNELNYRLMGYESRN